ncbi:hypothetical protein PWG15_12455 [Ensifer adhaerens]|uniref:hypothetical protein n=1 Tax=Ensifer adhaerens TaxID=106592 RepID=UPI0023A968D7|nr:hypothetical protein [Ensifer adhaerens]WDZ75428.1 hypothetical protein PWG15_12455 [Ensifer adhaerens]
MNLLTGLARLIRRAKAPDLVSFWHGPIDAMTYGCLASFPYYGARLRVYSYDDSIQVPPGIDLADAREICSDASLVDRYIVDGKVEFSKFSNLFRYLLVQKTGCCWVDCDFICLRRPEFQKHEMAFGYQLGKDHPAAINGAVLKLPREHAVLTELIEHARGVVDLDQHWGVIGPRLITPKFNEAGLSKFASSTVDYYPISHLHFWKLLLPEERENVEAATRSSKLLHLWHHMFEVAGYNKELAPPKGSYVYDALERVGALHRFSGAYDTDHLKIQLNGWLPAESKLLGS